MKKKTGVPVQGHGSRPPESSPGSTEGGAGADGPHREVADVPLDEAPEQTGPAGSITHLLGQALAESRQLARLEVELAKLEMKEQLSSARLGGVGIGIGGVLGVCGLSLLLVAVALAFSPTWLPAFLVGLAALALAGVLTVLGYRDMPKKPLIETRNRARSELELLKDRYT